MQIGKSVYLRAAFDITLHAHYWFVLHLRNTWGIHIAYIDPKDSADLATNTETSFKSDIYWLGVCISEKGW